MDGKGHYYPKCYRCRAAAPTPCGRCGGPRDGSQMSYCKACSAAYSAAWSKNNKDSRRLSYRKALLKSEYGMTIDDWDAMFDGQQGRCATCGTVEPGGKDNKLHVDHCHVTGAVRGLLCNNCNRALGLVGDSAVRLRALADYVELHASSTGSPSSSPSARGAGQ